MYLNNFKYNTSTDTLYTFRKIILVTILRTTDLAVHIIVITQLKK